MSRSITDAVYNRYACDKEKREALDAWESALKRIPSAPTAASAIASGVVNDRVQRS